MFTFRNCGHIPILKCNFLPSGLTFFFFLWVDNFLFSSGLTIFFDLWRLHERQDSFWIATLALALFFLNQIDLRKGRDVSHSVCSTQSSGRVVNIGQGKTTRKRWRQAFFFFVTIGSRNVLVGRGWFVCFFWRLIEVLRASQFVRTSWCLVAAQMFSSAEANTDSAGGVRRIIPFPALPPFFATCILEIVPPLLLLPRFCLSQTGCVFCFFLRSPMTRPQRKANCCVTVGR